MAGRAGPTAREVVGLFDSREAFDRAVAALLAAGWKPHDLSVLASHDSLDIEDPEPEGRAALTASLGEIKYVTPTVTAGFIALAGGPIVAPIAALIAGAMGALALTDYIQTLTAHPDPDSFARALEFGGLMLWARVENDKDEAAAAKLMEAEGGREVHAVDRPAARSDSQA